MDTMRILDTKGGAMKVAGWVVFFLFCATLTAGVQEGVTRQQFPIKGNDYIESTVIVNVDVNGDSIPDEVVQMPACMIIKRSTPYLTPRGCGKIDIDICSWTARGYSDSLGGNIEFSLSDMEQPLSAVVAKDSAVDYPCTLEFNAVFNVTIEGLGTVPGLFGSAGAIMNTIPPASGQDTFWVEKTFFYQEWDIGIDPILCACAAAALNPVGDVDDNFNVNVIDALRTVNVILDLLEPTYFQLWAGDCNQDCEIDILDVIGIVNVILGINTCPPTEQPRSNKRISDSSAQIRIPEICLEAAADFTLPICIDTEDEIRGVQFKLMYDADKLTPGTVKLTDRSAQMTVASNVRDGELIVAVYSLDGSNIQAGTGSIVDVPFKVADGAVGNGMLEITEAVLAKSCTETIPVEIITEAIRLGDLLPEIYALSQNFPNPFNPVTEISYQLPTESGVKLGIYNILGQKVRTLVNYEQPAGQYTVRWDGKDSSGADVASGVYFYRIVASDFTATKRMVLLK